MSITCLGLSTCVRGSQGWLCPDDTAGADEHLFAADIGIRLEQHGFGEYKNNFIGEF